MKYRSKRMVEAYYYDGTPESASAIIQAIPGTELLTDTLGEVRLMVPGGFGNCKMPVGSWIYHEYSYWSIARDQQFRHMWEVSETDGEVEAAAARVREGLATKKALHEAFIDPDDGPYELGRLYETEPGTGRTLWEIDLADVALLVGAENDK